MAILNVKRADDGSIAEISKQITAADYLRFGAFAALMAGLAIYLHPFVRVRLTAFVHDMDLQTGAALAVLVVSVGVMLVTLYRLHPGRSILLADRGGVHFLFYQELGTVPWSAIEEFDQEASTLWIEGDTLLVVQLRNQDDWILRLNASNMFNPLTANPLRGPRVPFATLGGSMSLDLDALQNALSEMKTHAG
jgi:hypothetical protein